VVRIPDGAARAAAATLDGGGESFRYLIIHEGAFPQTARGAAI
jgi:hypothetical protein